MEKKEINDNEIFSLVKQALQQLYEKDSHLIQINASERAIVAKFSCYFAHLPDAKIITDKYDVDVEYNRYKTAVKKLSTGSVTIDFIVHKRGKSDNLIAIEFKTLWNETEEGRKNDEDRIQELCTSENYNYKYGFTIVLGKDLETTVAKFYNKLTNEFQSRTVV